MQQPKTPPGIRGVTLIELMLATVIIGLLASLVAPYFGRQREETATATVATEVRALMTALENYRARHEAWPESIADLEAESLYTPPPGVEYCLFHRVPGHEFRMEYVYFIAAHPQSSLKVSSAYPLWGRRLLEIPTETPGC